MALETGQRESSRERLFDASVDLLCVAEVRGFFEDVNPAWTRRLGWSRKELVSRPWIEWVHPDDRDRTLAALVELEDTGELWDLEVRCAHKDGGFRWLSWNLSLVSEGKLFVAVVRDVTQRRHDEGKTQLALASIEHSIVPTYWIGEDARPRYANEAACRSLGCSLDELMNMHVWDFDPTFSPSRWRAHRDGLKREGHRVIESIHRRKDGSTFPVEVTIAYLEFQGEQLSVSYARDISQSKRAESERAQMLAREQAARAEAQQANSAKDRFIAVLSHELRNPLNAIMASIDLLQLSSDGVVAARALEIAARNAKLEARMLDDLLDLSRVVRGKVVLQRTPVELERVVRLAAESLQENAANAAVRLEVEATSDLWVDADADRLQQVVTNLLTNALKFTPAGGRVRVGVERTGEGGRIVVEDTGIGIEPARLPSLFDIMFRETDPRGRGKPGLGIGLALVKSIVQMHGGRVWAESGGLGQGSRFTVELPLAAQVAAGPEGRQKRGGSPGRPTLVFLVEDNADTREILGESLRMLGYSVTEAGSGEEALHLLPASAPDIILADIGLPGMDGYEFLRQARQLFPEVAGVPALALTGYGQPSDVRKSHEAGFVDHLVKPVDLQLLEERIRTFVGIARAPGAEA